MIQARGRVESKAGKEIVHGAMLSLRDECVQRGVCGAQQSGRTVGGGGGGPRIVESKGEEPQGKSVTEQCGKDNWAGSADCFTQNSKCKGGEVKAETGDPNKRAGHGVGGEYLASPSGFEATSRTGCTQASEPEF